MYENWRRLDIEKSKTSTRENEFNHRYCTVNKNQNKPYKNLCLPND